MYLARKRRRYYLEHRLPPKAAQALGKSKLSRSLGTESKTEAERLKPLVEAELRRELAEAMSESPDELARNYRLWRQAYLNAQTEDQRELERDLLADHLLDKDIKAAQRHGISLDDHTAINSLPEHEENRHAYQYVTGQRVLLTEYLESYLSYQQVKPKTADQRRASIRKLAEQLPYVQDITGAAVQRVVDQRLTSGAAIDTIRRDLSDARSYWRYLAAKELVPEDSKPFDSRYLPNKSKQLDTGRQAYTSAEAVSLLRAAAGKPDPELADLIRLGMFSGARREELCAMKVTDIANGHMTIRDAKTRAGLRTIPVHTRLQPIVDRLIGDRTDGYLLPGLSVDKYGKRGDAIGKRFGKLKTRLGFGPQHVFHSLRHTLVSLLEEAGVTQNIAASIAGHTKQGFTFREYSKADLRQHMVEAMARIDYPELADETMA